MEFKLSTRNMSKLDLPSLLHLLLCVIDYKWLVIILASYAVIAAKTLAIYS
jgi:hypothetical protein